MALKESQRLERELTGYVDWICRAEDLVLAEDRTTEADREMILEGELDSTFLFLYNLYIDECNRHDGLYFVHISSIYFI